MNRTSRAHRAAVTGFLLAALSTVVVLATPMSASAVDDGSIGIRPAHESDFLYLSARPGETIATSAIVSNSTADPVTLLTYPVDAVSDLTGTFAMAAQTDPRTGVGAWTSLTTDELVVAAESEVPVELLVAVPEGTPPGDYAGALIIQSPPTPGETTTVDGVAVRIDVVQRQGLRIYLTVEGDARERLDAGPLEWRQEGDDLVVTWSLHNTGTTTLHPEAAAELGGWPIDARRIEFDVPAELLPGARVELEARVPGAPPVLVGELVATATTDAGVERVRTSLVYAPWWLAAIPAAMVAAALAAIWWRVLGGGRRAPRRARASFSSGRRTGARRPAGSTS